MNMKWISVKERLPKPGRIYLVTFVSSSGDAFVIPARYIEEVLKKDGRVVRWKDMQFRLISQTVTHWMELPQPAEQKK